MVEPALWCFGAVFGCSTSDTITANVRGMAPDGGVVGPICWLVLISELGDVCGTEWALSGVNTPLASLLFASFVCRVCGCRGQAAIAATLRAGDFRVYVVRWMFDELKEYRARVGPGSPLACERQREERMTETA